MTNDAAYLFTCSFSICISSLGKYLFKSFLHLLVGLLVFLPLSCKSSMRFYEYITYVIQWIYNIYWQIYFANILSKKSVVCLFICLKVSFEDQMFNFDKIQFIDFFFFCSFFVVLYLRNFGNSSLLKFSPMSFSFV